MSMTHLTDDVGLELAGEDGVDDAVAVGGVDVAAAVAPPDQVPVQQVQRRDEELVSVLRQVHSAIIPNIPHTICINHNN